MRTKVIVRWVGCNILNFYIHFELFCIAFINSRVRIPISAWCWVNLIYLIFQSLDRSWNLTDIFFFFFPIFLMIFMYFSGSIKFWSIKLTFLTFDPPLTEVGLLTYGLNFGMKILVYFQLCFYLYVCTQVYVLCILI